MSAQPRLASSLEAVPDGKKLYMDIVPDDVCVWLAIDGLAGRSFTCKVVGRFWDPRFAIKVATKHGVDAYTNEPTPFPDITNLVEKGHFVGRCVTVDRDSLFEPMHHVRLVRRDNESEIELRHVFYHAAYAQLRLYRTFETATILSQATAFTAARDSCAMTDVGNIGGFMRHMRSIRMSLALDVLDAVLREACSLFDENTVDRLGWTRVIMEESAVWGPVQMLSTNMYGERPDGRIAESLVFTLIKGPTGNSTSTLLYYENDKLVLDRAVVEFLVQRLLDNTMESIRYVETTGLWQC